MKGWKMTDGIRVCRLATLVFFESSIDFGRIALKAAIDALRFLLFSENYFPGPTYIF